MKRLTMTVLSLLVYAATAAAADRSAACGTGTLEDVEMVTEAVPQVAITTVRDKRRRPGEREQIALTTPAERQDKKYVVTVRLDDMVYTGESSANWFWDFNPTRFVINDLVQICVSKDRLRLRRPDGKDYETKIIRVARDASRTSDARVAR
jgi:hypothetical protein